MRAHLLVSSSLRPLFMLTFLCCRFRIDISTTPARASSKAPRARRLALPRLLLLLPLLPLLTLPHGSYRGSHLQICRPLWVYRRAGRRHTSSEMLRFTQALLRVQSHQKKRAQHPNAGTRYGRVYNRGFVRYGFGGFGMSVYTPKKDRTFKVMPVPPSPPATTAAEQRDDFADNRGLVATTRTLSPTFRMFALEDGGVLVSHPSHAQVMRWNQRVHTEEGKATNRTTMDEYVNSRIQAIIADNTIENTSLSQWRKAHMWNVIKSHGRLQRRWGTPDFITGARSTLYNN